MYFVEHESFTSFETGCIQVRHKDFKLQGKRNQ